VALLIIPGLVFFSGIVLYALANTVNVHTKAQTEAQGGFWSYLLAGLTGQAAVHTVVKWTRSAVSRWALAGLKPVAAWFVAVNVLLKDTFKTNADMAEATAKAVERITHHTIPAEAGKAALPAKTAAKNAQKTAAGAAATAAATAHAFHGYRVATAPKITHATHAVDVVFPGRIGVINREIDKVSRDQAKLRERTTSLENGALKTFEWIRAHPLSLATGVFAGAVAIALQRIGWGVLRCRSWQKLGRSLTCGIGSWLSDLLALIATFALAGLSVLDPEVLAEAAVKTVDVIEPIMQEMLP
jgi:hypothetical protein